MSQYDWLLPMIMGVVFILLGLGTVAWGRKEERHYYDGLTTRPDAREFMEHWPPRPQFGALKIGGWIAMAVGLVTTIIGISLLL